LRNAESGLHVLVNMAANSECVPYIVQLFHNNLTSIVAVLDRASNDKLNQLIGTLLDRLLQTLLVEAELALAKRSDQTNMNTRKDEPSLPHHNSTGPSNRLSARFVCGRQNGPIHGGIPPLSHLLCPHERAVFCADLNALLQLCIGCMRGGQSLQFIALLQLNKIVDVLAVYSLTDHKPIAPVCTQCPLHGPRCCTKRAEQRAADLAATAAASGLLASAALNCDNGTSTSEVDGKSHTLASSSDLMSPAAARKRSPSAWNLLLGGQSQLLANRLRNRFRRRTESAGVTSGGASGSLAGGSSAEKSSSIERSDDLRRKPIKTRKVVTRRSKQSTAVTSGAVNCQCCCRRVQPSASQLLSEHAVSLLLNVLNNAITMHKRCAYPKPLCTPSNR
jgi:hypothetical protein